MGIKNYNVTAKTGPVADVKIVTGEEDILLISDDGTIIRTPADSISLQSRTAQGVRVMRLLEGSRVICMETTEKEAAGEGDTPEETENE